MVSSIVANTNVNVIDGGAALDVHIGGANQTAYAAAAPAGIRLMSVQDPVAGYRTVFEHASRIVSGAGHTGQSANTVPALRRLIMQDLRLVIGVHNNVFELCSGCDAKEAHALGVGIDLNILDHIRLTVIAGIEKRHIRVSFCITVGIVIHTANGGIIRHSRSVNIMALEPVQLQFLSGRRIAIIAPDQIGEPAVIDMIRSAGILGRDEVRG